MGYYRSKAPKNAKIRSQRVEFDGFQFPSLTEAETYKALKEKRDVGEISNLQVQPKFPLFPRLTNVRIENKMAGWDALSPCEYTSDFMYHDNITGRNVVCESKGLLSDLNKLRLRMFLQQYLPLYDFVLVTAKWHQQKGELYLKELFWHWYYYDTTPPVPKKRGRK